MDPNENENTEDLDDGSTEEVEEAGGIASQNLDDFNFDGKTGPSATDESETDEDQDSGDQETHDQDTNDNEESTEGDDDNSDDSSASSDANDDSDQETTDEQPLDVGQVLRENSNGRIKSIEELNDVFKQLDTLKEQLSKPPEIQFDSVAKQKMYEFVTKHGNGEDPQTANTYLQLMNVDIASMSEKDILFAEFRVNNPHISESEAREIHNEEMEEDFSEESLESSARKRHQYSERVRKGRETLSTLQKEHTEGLPKSEEQSTEDQAALEAEQQKQTREQIQSAAQNYKGVNMGFKATDKGVEAVEYDASKPLDSFNFEVDDAQMLDLTEKASDPEFWNKFFQGEDGKVDMGKYLDQVNLAVNGKAVITKAVQHGYNIAKVALEKKMGNIKDPPPPGKKTQKDGEKSLADVIGEAMG